MAEKAICFEVSEDGQRVIKENWMINKSPGELEVYGEANEQSIASIAATLPAKTLVLVDIEGFEFLRLMNKSNFQQTKNTRPRSINGLLMTKVNKPKLKLPSVLSVGGLQA